MSDISTLSLKPWYNTDSVTVICAGDPAGMDQLVTECLAHQMTYVYDVGQQVTNLTQDQLKHGVSGAHMLFANDYELGVIVSRTGYSEAKLNQLIPIIVTSLGERGTRITGASVKKPLLIPAVADVSVIDPTGAGDSYRAGFLYGYRRRFDLTVCARLGSVVASYAIAVRGTQEHYYALADIKQKYYTAYGDQIPN